MSRKRCKRIPRALINPITMATEGAAITAPALLDRLRMTELSAIEAFRTGQATVDDWRILADISNLAETFASMGIGPEVLPVVAQMEAHLREAHDRFQRTKRLGLTGEGLTAAREIYEFHDLQRSSVSRREYEVAIKKTTDRVRSAHADQKFSMEG